MNSETCTYHDLFLIAVLYCDDVTKFIWQRSHIPSEFTETSITGSGAALGKLGENLFGINSLLKIEDMGLVVR